MTGVAIPDPSVAINLTRCRWSCQGVNRRADRSGLTYLGELGNNGKNNEGCEVDSKQPRIVICVMR